MTDLQDYINTHSAAINKIRAAEEEVKELYRAINTLSPFNIGDTLVCNDWTNEGDKFVVDKTFVSSASKSAITTDLKRGTLYFIAEGRNLLKNGNLGKRRIRRGLKITKDMEV